MMQLRVLSNRNLPVLDSSVSGTTRFVEAVRGAAPARGQSRGGGGTLTDERQQVASDGRAAIEAESQSSAAANAVAAATMLQTADDALAEIGARLDELASVAEAASSPDRSRPGRRQMDARFAFILSDVDSIAERTSFNGVVLLQGGSGPGGVLEIQFQVGGGSGAASELTIKLPPANAASLSSGLAHDSVATGEGARVARVNVSLAAQAVDAIRAGIARDRRRIAAAYRNGQTLRRAADAAGEGLTSPSMAIDLSRVLATRIAEEGGIAVADRTLDRFRQLLLGFDQQMAGT
jgi:flagellin